MNAPVKIISFGFLHNAEAGPPAADVTFDVRDRFRDPHFDRSLRELTAEDSRVRNAVMATPGVRELVTGILALAWSCLRGPDLGPVVLAVGCSGGRHRGPAIAAEVAWHLERQGFTVEVEHRDIRRPVVQRPALSGVA